MNDKEYREQKKRVQKYINKWFTTLGMGWFDIHFGWCRHERTDDTGALSVAADTDASWEYRRARINWYLPVIMEIDDDSLENTVIHEFVHVLLDPLKPDPDKRKELEYATESVTRAIEWARRAGKDDK